MDHPIRWVYDEEFDVLYGGYEGSAPGAGAEEPAPALVIERDRQDAVTGCVLMDARRQWHTAAVQAALAEAGIAAAPPPDGFAAR